MSLAGSKTEQNLKDAFAGESQANRRTSTLPPRQTLKVTTMLRLFSVPLQKVKPVMPMAIWNTWKKLVIRLPGYQLVVPQTT